jgi:hypothetical protein
LEPHQLKKWLENDKCKDKDFKVSDCMNGIVSAKKSIYARRNDGGQNLKKHAIVSDSIKNKEGEKVY